LGERKRLSNRFILSIGSERGSISMISLVKESKLTPAKVIELAEAYFGPGGIGLEVVDCAECCARFEGGGGHVFVQTAAGERDRGSQVNIEAREWERAAEKFLEKI